MTNGAIVRTVSCVLCGLLAEAAVEAAGRCDPANGSLRRPPLPASARDLSDEVVELSAGSLAKNVERQAVTLIVPDGCGAHRRSTVRLLQTYCFRSTGLTLPIASTARGGTVQPRAA